MFPTFTPIFKAIFKRVFKDGKSTFFLSLFIVVAVPIVFLYLYAFMMQLTGHYTTICNGIDNSKSCSYDLWVSNKIGMYYILLPVFSLGGSILVPTLLLWKFLESLRKRSLLQNSTKP